MNFMIVSVSWEMLSPSQIAVEVDPYVIESEVTADRRVPAQGWP